MNKTKFTLKLQKVLGGYKIVRDEYKDELTLLHSDTLGSFNTVERAKYFFQKYLDNISPQLFTAKSKIESGGTWFYQQIDYIFNDLSDVDLFIKGKQ